MTFDLSDSGISRSLLLVGDREREHRFMLQKAITKGDTILDLGANIGYYVLMENKLLAEGGHVIAVEPEVNNFNLLKNNIELNNISASTTTINAAITDQDGSIKLFLSKLGNVHSLKKEQTDKYTGTSVDVAAISLKTMAKKYPGIDLIRMDIEGYEQEILQSLLDINENQTFLPKILFELHPLKYDLPKFSQVLEDIFKLGYIVQYLATSHKDLLKKHGLNVLASLPTDGTIRHITPNVPLDAFLDLYPHSRAVLLQHHKQ